MSEDKPSKTVDERFFELSLAAIYNRANDADYKELDELLKDAERFEQYQELVLKGTLAREVYGSIMDVRAAMAAGKSKLTADPLFHAFIVADLAGDDPQKVANLQKALAGLGDTLDTSDAYDFGRFSLITYNGVANAPVTSCSPGEFKAPDMIAHRSDTRSLGSAYKLLAEQREKEVKPDDWGAMAFTLMNGTPTDDWEKPANRIKELFGPNSIVIDQSGEVDAKVMEEATELGKGFRIKGTESKDYDQLIKGIGDTVDQTSSRNSTMGHSIKAEQEKTSSPLPAIGGVIMKILEVIAF